MQKEGLAKLVNKYSRRIRKRINWLREYINNTDNYLTRDKVDNINKKLLFIQARMYQKYNPEWVDYAFEEITGTIKKGIERNKKNIFKYSAITGIITSGSSSLATYSVNYPNNSMESLIIGASVLGTAFAFGAIAQKIYNRRKREKEFIKIMSTLNKIEYAIEKNRTFRGFWDKVGDELYINYGAVIDTSEYLYY